MEGSRFIYYSLPQIINDKETGKRYYGNKQVADLLSELYKENERLKKQLNAFKPIIFEDANGGSSVLYEKVEE